MVLIGLSFFTFAHGILNKGTMLKAGDRSRTGDLQLGKLTLYQLSYARGPAKLA